MALISWEGEGIKISHWVAVGTGSPSVIGPIWHRLPTKILHQPTTTSTMTEININDDRGRAGAKALTVGTKLMGYFGGEPVPYGWDR